MEDLHEQIRELKKRIESEKALRDEENKKVVEFKKKRNDLLDKMTVLRVELAKLESELEKSSDIVDEPFGELKKAYKDLDWKYQTGVMSHAKEKDIVKTLQEMEKKILIASEIMEKRKKLNQLFKEIRKLKIESDINHALVKKHAAESEKHHQNMLAAYDQLSKLEFKARQQSPVRHITKPIKRIVQRFGGKQDDKLRIKAEQILVDFKKGKKIPLQDLALLEKYGLY